jgi:phage shock protein PspC (stress-responsive transcriptional regulator)
MFGGVAGGLAEYFNTDPTLIKIIFIITFFAGCGLLAYIIMWIVVPKEPITIFTPDAYAGQKTSGEAAVPDPRSVYESERKKRGGFYGTVLIIIGVLFLWHNFFPGNHFKYFWPLILIAIGAGLLMRSRNN